MFVWNNRPVRALLFDLDGTLADTKHAHADAWVRWAARHNIAVSRDEYMSDYFGRSNKEVMPGLMPHLAHQPDVLHELALEKERDFLAVSLEGGIPPMPGLHELVRRALARGLPMAIASAAPRDNVETIARILSLDDHIHVRLSQDHVTHPKPAPDIYLMAAEHLGVAPADCVVFEDSRFGLMAGHAAGCRTIAILSLHTEEELKDEADLCVRDFDALLERDEWRGF